MDKLRKKQFKKEYLQQELLKEASSDNEILANFAKQKLGIPLDSIDSSTIQNIPESEIELRIYSKVLERISKRQCKDRGLNEKQIVSELPAMIQLTYYIFILDSEIFNGGFESYYSNTAGEYIFETINLIIPLEIPEIVEILEKSVGLFILYLNQEKDIISGNLNAWTEISARINKQYYIDKTNNTSFSKLDYDFQSLKYDFEKLRIKYLKTTTWTLK